MKNYEAERDGLRYEGADLMGRLIDKTPSVSTVEQLKFIKNCVLYSKAPVEEIVNREHGELGVIWENKQALLALLFFHVAATKLWIITKEMPKSLATILHDMSNYCLNVNGIGSKDSNIISDCRVSICKGEKLPHIDNPYDILLNKVVYQSREESSPIDLIAGVFSVIEEESWDNLYKEFNQEITERDIQIFSHCIFRMIEEKRSKTTLSNNAVGQEFLYITFPYESKSNIEVYFELLDMMRNKLNTKIEENIGRLQRDIDSCNNEKLFLTIDLDKATPEVMSYIDALYNKPGVEITDLKYNDKLYIDRVDGYKLQLENMKNAFKKFDHSIYDTSGSSKDTSSKLLLQNIVIDVLKRFKVWINGINDDIMVDRAILTILIYQSVHNLPQYGITLNLFSYLDVTISHFTAHNDSSAKTEANIIYDPTLTAPRFRLHITSDMKSEMITLTSNDKILNKLIPIYDDLSITAMRDHISTEIKTFTRDVIFNNRIINQSAYDSITNHIIDYIYHNFIVPNTIKTVNKIVEG